MSKKLDEELAEAIRPTGDEGDAPGLEKSAAPVKAEAPRKRDKSVGLLIALLAMVGAVVALFLVGFKSAAVYAIGVDKLVQDKTLAGRKVRVEGELVPGTLAKRDQPCEYRFTLHGAAEKLSVRYPQCVIPDTFRDMPGGGVQVTVEGSMSPAGQFDATLVMAKCASKYDPSTHKMKGDDNAALPVN